jgi:hypothetical protein
LYRPILSATCHGHCVLVFPMMPNEIEVGGAPAGVNDASARQNPCQGCAAIGEWRLDSR